LVATNWRNSPPVWNNFAGRSSGGEFRQLVAARPRAFPLPGPEVDNPPTTPRAGQDYLWPARLFSNGSAAGSIDCIRDPWEVHLPAAVRAGSLVAHLMQAIAQPTPTACAAKMIKRLLRRLSSAQIEPDADGSCDHDSKQYQHLGTGHRLRLRLQDRMSQPA